MTGKLRVAIWSLIIAAGAVADAAWAAPKIKPSRAIEIGLQDTSGVRAVAALKSGGALYAFTDDDDILVRPVAADGEVGPAKSLTTVGRSEFGVPEAAMTRLTNGNLVVVWAATPGPRSAVFARVVRPDGSAVSSELAVSDEPFSSQRDVSVAALADGRFAIGWSSAADDGKTKLRGRLYTAGGQGVGDPAVISPPAGASVLQPAIAPHRSGFVMVYVRSEGGGVLAQRFDDRAKRTGAALRLDPPNARVHENPSVVALGSGGYAALWEENVYSTAGSLPIVVDRTLKGRFVSESGDLGGTFAVEDAVAERSLERGAALIEVPAGLLVAWSLSFDRGGTFDNDVRGTIVRQRRAGPVKTLTRETEASEISPRLALLKDGRVALGFGATSADATVEPRGALASFLTIRN